MTIGEREGSRSAYASVVSLFYSRISKKVYVIICKRPQLPHMQHDLLTALQIRRSIDTFSQRYIMRVRPDLDIPLLTANIHLCHTPRNICMYYTECSRSMYIFLLHFSIHVVKIPELHAPCPAGM